MTTREHDVCAFAELRDHEMRQVERDGEQILLARSGDAVFAVGATCPHAGGPLVDGVRSGDTVLCPWHKARFCLRAGALLDPPAVDPLPRYAARIANGRVLITTPAQKPAPAEKKQDYRTFAIIGGGAAGAVAAQTLREAGFGGRIVMFDRENRVPYDRTVLSKYFLSGEHGGEKTPLQMQGFYREQNIERRTAEIVHLDAATKRITCANGTALGYDAALIATGGIPRRPWMPGSTLGNVFVLRDRAHADAILTQAERSGRAAVLGTSFIAMEVAASLRERGLDVTVIGQEAQPFEKHLGAAVGIALRHLHERRGVAFRLGTNVAALEGRSDVSSVLLESGERIPADLVVVGFGVMPATAFLGDVLRNDDGSVSVDAFLRVADGLYAAGDIARFPLWGDGPAIRVEHWRVAQQHGRVAGFNMVGQSRRYDAVPVFWTIQYLKRLDYIGHAESWDDIVLYGDTEKPEFLAYYVKEHRVLAAAGLDRDRDTAALIELLSMRREWKPEELGAEPARTLAMLQ
jgi:apoptosis-inducing factor 3